MSEAKYINFNVGMKYDLSSIKDSMIESAREFKKIHIRCRNYHLLCNKKEKEKQKKQKSPKNRNVFKIKRKDVMLDDSLDNKIPKGYYCYPIKGSYFQKSSFELTFFPLLPLDKFKEAISTFADQKSLSETYQSYPCLSNSEYKKIKKIIMTEYGNTFEGKPVYKGNDLEDDNITVRPAHCTSNINTIFVIWCFINIIKEILNIMDKSFYQKYNSERNAIIIPIVEQMSVHLKIEINILYYIIDNYINDVNKYINKKSLAKKGISFKKYEKYCCEICYKFFCPYHFKIKVKPLTLANGKIRTITQYFKKLDTTIKYREYLEKELIESQENKDRLKLIINRIRRECQCKRQPNKDFFKFDPSLRFNKMAEINKEDFFILCKMLKTIKKIIGNFGHLYENNQIYHDYQAPCVFRRILHNKYDCSLLYYLIKLIMSENDNNNKDYLENINFFLSSELGDNTIYEIIKEDNYLFFNVSNELNLNTQKSAKKKDKDKQINTHRVKTTAKIQLSSEKNLYYKPCNHYPSECTEQNCPCAKNGYCLKYCCCYKGKNNNSCIFLFEGCQFCKHNVNSKKACIDCKCVHNNMECNPNLCKCEGNCSNVNTTIGKRKKLLFGYSEKIKGGGLFAGEKIFCGEYIDSYDGEICEKDELDRLSIFYDQTGNNYPFSINEKLDFVTIKCGSMTRYINHGSHDEDNIKADRIMVNGVPFITFHAIRDINKYEELLYDYSYAKESMPQWYKEYDERMERKKKKIKIKEEELNKQYDTKYGKLHPKKKAHSSYKKKELKKNNNDYDENEEIFDNPNVIRLKLTEEDEDEQYI